MEENSLTPNQSPAPNGTGRKWNLHALAFLEVGLFELVFVTVILALLFGTLNYFNILPVSNAFPKYFSWLPRQKAPTSPPHYQKFTLPDIIPSPTSVSKTLSSPEKENATKISQDLIDKFIKPEYQSTITLEEKILTIDGEAQPFPYYSAAWKKDSVSASLILQYDFIARNAISVDINLDVPTITDTVTASSAKDIAGKYISVVPNTQFFCNTPTSPGIVQCNSSMEIQSDPTSLKLRGASKSKVGFSLRANPKESPAGAKNAIIICQTLPSSNRYSWTTCLHE